MERRTFLSVLSGSLLAAPLTAPKQWPEGLPRIGYLSPTSRGMAVDVKFREELGELGYIEGRNIAVEERFAAGSPDRLVALARELVALKVAVIVAVALPAIQAAREVTRTIPIVMAFSSDDPVKRGLVEELGPAGRQRHRCSTILASDLQCEAAGAVEGGGSRGTRRVAVLLNPGQSPRRSIS